MVNDRDRRQGRRNWLPLILGAIVLIALLFLLLRACSEASDTDYGLTDSPPGESISTEPDTEGLNAPTTAAAVPTAYASGQLGRTLSGTDRLPLTYELATVNFDSGSAALDDDANDEIADVAAALRARPSARVALRGFADPEGDEAANQKLSVDRANAVRKALVAAGASDDQIEIDALGETGEGAVRQNRRVELTVTAR